ncbi:unnamed protein product [Protopolystoma xenopodis]|uniref:Uncharacterized protein n=1 Tax=Protopolystoma xenopodis TaxID=117903 RepID=A0A3S5A4A9_9PLAT|nr:unnamed protein product [Protopolystoma xenopodis]
MRRVPPPPMPRPASLLSASVQLRISSGGSGSSCCVSTVAGSSPSPRIPSTSGLEVWSLEGGDTVRASEIAASPGGGPLTRADLERSMALADATASGAAAESAGAKALTDIVNQIDHSVRCLVRLKASHSLRLSAAEKNPNRFVKFFTPEFHVYICQKLSGNVPNPQSDSRN